MSQITRDIANNFSKKKYDAAISSGLLRRLILFFVVFQTTKFFFIAIFSHPLNQGWENFTDKVIQILSNHKKNLNNINIKKNIFITVIFNLKNIYDKKTRRYF